MDIITYGLLNKKIKQKADLDSPHFTGTPTAPTADTSVDNDQIATTAFVHDALENIGPGTTYALTRQGKFIVLTASTGAESYAELPYWYMSTAEWEEQPLMVSEPGALYIWSDWYQDEQGNNIPGVKVGDGNAYVSHLPFQNEDFLSHILNTDIHVTAEEKAYWDDKVTCYISPNDPTNLIFTKDNIIFSLVQK